jgi:hypothetical protein
VKVQVQARTYHFFDDLHGRWEGLGIFPENVPEVDVKEVA